MCLLAQGDRSAKQGSGPPFPHVEWSPPLKKSITVTQDTSYPMPPRMRRSPTHRCRPTRQSTRFHLRQLWHIGVIKSLKKQPTLKTWFRFIAQPYMLHVTIRTFCFDTDFASAKSPHWCWRSVQTGHWGESEWRTIQLSDISLWILTWFWRKLLIQLRTLARCDCSFLFI